MTAAPAFWRASGRSGHPVSVPSRHWTLATGIASLVRRNGRAAEYAGPGIVRPDCRRTLDGGGNRRAVADFVAAEHLDIVVDLPGWRRAPRLRRILFCAAEEPDAALTVGRSSQSVASGLQHISMLFHFPLRSSQISAAAGLGVFGSKVAAPPPKTSRLPSQAAAPP